MRRKDALYCCYFLFFLFVNASAQPTILARYWQNQANATIDVADGQGDNNLWLGGRFEEQFHFSPFTTTAAGGDDIFLSKMDEQGNISHFFSGGSQLDDELVAIATTSQGGLCATGTFWVDADFGTVSLRSTNSPKGIFLLFLNDALQVEWGKSLSATTAITVEDLAVDAAQNIWVTGSFKGDFMVEDSLLFSSSTQVLLLCCFNPKGELLKAFYGNPSAKSVGKALVSLQDGTLAIAGDFEGNFVWGNDTIATNTTDTDVFLATLSKEGTASWLRKAGGVFRSEVEAIVNLDTTLFLVGNFLGVMTLNEQINIQSLGFNDNIFLLAYRTNGTPLWAKSIGGAELEQVTSLATHQNHLLLGGYFLNQFKTDATMLQGNPMVFNGFLLQTDQKGREQWAKSVTSDGTSLISAVVVTGHASSFASGYFQGNWTEFGYQSMAFNPFLIEIQAPITPVHSSFHQPFSISYDPLESTIHLTAPINNYQVRFFDAYGRLLQQHKNTNKIRVQHLTPGIYYITIAYAAQVWSAPIFIPSHD